MHWDLLSYIGDTRIQVWKRSGHVHKLMGDGKSLRTAGTVDKALSQAQKVRSGRDAAMY